MIRGLLTFGLLAFLLAGFVGALWQPHAALNSAGQMDRTASHLVIDPGITTFTNFEFHYGTLVSLRKPLYVRIAPLQNFSMRSEYGHVPENEGFLGYSDVTITDSEHVRFSVEGTIMNAENGVMLSEPFPVQSPEMNFTWLSFSRRHSVITDIRWRGLHAPVNGLMLVCFIAVATLGTVMCCCMHQQRPHGHRPDWHQHAAVGDAGPPYVGTATLKVPPAWSIERNVLRSWLSDLVLWASATDLAVQRQGPVAALQITGSAKEIIREIPPAHLRDGVHDNVGNHTPGLMILVQTLVQRYGPLEVEQSTKALSEYLNLFRLHGESIDSFLVRYEVLRHRAAQQGNLGMNATGAAWLLLRACRIGHEQLERLLAANNGQLPQDEGQLTQLLERLRNLGHLREGGLDHGPRQGATGNPGAYYFPTFGGAGGEEPGPFGGAAPNFDVDPWMQYLNQRQQPQQQPHQPQAQPAFGGGCHGCGGAMPGQDPDFCGVCGCYFGEDEEFSSGTDTEADVDENFMNQCYQSVDIEGTSRSDAMAVANEIYYDYKMAKQRWRRFSGKPPRKYRKYNVRRGQGPHRLQRSSYRNSYASFLPPSAFAGGKGGGKGKGKGGARKNPRGKDGQVLTCAKCGSDSHLWRECPQGGGKGGWRPPGDHQASSAPPGRAGKIRRHPSAMDTGPRDRCREL